MIIHKKIIFIIALLFMVISSQHVRAQYLIYLPIIFKGELEIVNIRTIMTPQDRLNSGLTYWPDGILYFDPPNIFYAAGNERSVKSTGTLDNPFLSWHYLRVHTTNNFNYFGGGPMYTAPTGEMVLFYHAETYYGSYQVFRSVVGTAVSYDGGVNFYDTGIAINAEDGGTIDIAGAPYLVVGDYFYLYTIDRHPDGAYQFLCVSRSTIADVLAGYSNWLKYADGDFTEPGLRGHCDSLITTQNGWMDLKRVGNKYYLVTTDGYIVRMFESIDGINWTYKGVLMSSSYELSYPTMIYDSDTLYLYFTQSALGGTQRWQDADYLRGEIINY